VHTKPQEEYSSWRDQTRCKNGLILCSLRGNVPKLQYQSIHW